MAQNAPPYSWNSGPNGDAKQPGLEVRPTWMNVKQPVDEAWPLPHEDKKSRRVCGLKPALFCLVLLLVIIVVGGAIGGGIGGYIATHPSPSPNPRPDNSSSTTSTPPPGFTDLSCSASYDGQFNLRIINATSTANRDEGLTICDADRKFPCVSTLESGVLENGDGMINYVNCNGNLHSTEDLSAPCKKFTEFSICANGSLSVGGSSLWYHCYTESWNDKGFYVQPKNDRCYPMYLTISAI